MFTPLVSTSAKVGYRGFRTSGVLACLIALNAMNLVCSASRASDGPGNKNSEEQRITKALVATTQRAVKHANAYCGTDKNISFNVSKSNRRLQFVFDMDQVLRSYLVGANSKYNWGAELNRFRVKEINFLSRVANNKREIKRILSQGFNPSSFELFVIAEHMSRHQPDLGRKVAIIFETASKRHDIFGGMAHVILKNAKNGKKIIARYAKSRPTTKLPARHGSQCFRQAESIYYERAISSDNFLAGLVVSAINSNQ